MDKRLVKITWVDASDPGRDISWFTEQDIEAFSNEVVEVVSVGWLKSETKLYTTIVADYIVNPDGSTTWGRPTKVPPGMITKMETLAVVPDTP